jgi:hypothetical protein
MPIITRSHERAVRPVTAEEEEEELLPEKALRIALDHGLDVECRARLASTSRGWHARVGLILPDLEAVNRWATRTNVMPNGYLGAYEAFGRYEVEQVQRAFVALRNPRFYAPSKSVQCGSYGLKHRIENLLRIFTRSHDMYVCNGAAIVAANFAGYRIQLAGDGPNIRIWVKKVFRQDIEDVRTQLAHVADAPLYVNCLARFATLNPKAELTRAKIQLKQEKMRTLQIERLELRDRMRLLRETRMRETGLYIMMSDDSDDDDGSLVE